MWPLYVTLIFNTPILIVPILLIVYLPDINRRARFQITPLLLIAINSINLVPLKGLTILIFFEILSFFLVVELTKACTITRLTKTRFLFTNLIINGLTTTFGLLLI